MDIKVKRVVAALIDFYIVCFLSSAFIGIFSFGKFTVTLVSIIMYLIVSFLILLVKDFVFKNASLGKRLFKLKVTKTDETKLTNIDIIKRNLPLLILLPLEILLIIINNRRIGDVWAKTSIVFDIHNTNKSVD